jgi:hypothetical protein
VDLAALQGALDDMVARHELLRTVVVRDADPPYQQVFPPCLRTSQFIISCHESQLGDDLIPIAEGAHEIKVRGMEEDGQRDIPSGMVWNLDLPPSGPLSGAVMFNLDEFDESTVAGWSAGLRRILAGAVREPDQNWKTL